MLRFFRQIRKTLMEQNKVRTYLLYAVGEILLVVIGILIALQVNNWNEQRKTSLEEEQYLSALLSDLKNDKTELLGLIENRELKASSATTLLSISREKGPDSVSQMGLLINDVFFWTEFTSKDNTFTELTSSGKLHILSSDSVKNGMLNLFSLYDDIRVYRDHIRREYDFYLYDIWAKYTTPKLDLNGGLSNNILISDEEFIQADEQLYIQEYQDLLQDKTFQSGLFLAIMNNKGMNENYRLAISQIDELIRLIED